PPPHLHTLSLHDALPIFSATQRRVAEQHAFDRLSLDLIEHRLDQRRLAGSRLANQQRQSARRRQAISQVAQGFPLPSGEVQESRDRKSTRLNSSHVEISY